MQAERGARGGRGRRPGHDRPGGDRDRPGGDRDRPGAAAAQARGGGGGDGGGRRGRGRGFRGGRGGRGGGAPRGGRREPGARGAAASAPVEDGSGSEICGDENEEQGTYSKRKLVSNWDRYQDTEKEVTDENGESQRGADFSVLLSSAGDSFSQFRFAEEKEWFAEEKEWDGETSCAKQNSALYVDSESLVRALQELPLSIRLNVAAELIQTAVPVELPQVKAKRNIDGKGLGMQLGGPISELRSSTAACPRSLGKDSPRPGLPEDSQKPTFLPQPPADHLEEELDLLLNLDAPIKGGDAVRPNQTVQDLGAEAEGQEETGLAKAAVTADTEKNEAPGWPSTSRPVTEEELEDWLDSMISCAVPAVSAVWQHVR